MNDLTAKTEREKELEALVAEKEARFAALMEHSQEAIWRIDIQPHVSMSAPISRQVREIFERAIYTEANDALARLYGLQKGRELIGRFLREFMLPTDPGNEERLAGMARQKYRLKNVVTHESDINGNPVSVLNNVTPLIKDGKLVSSWGTSIEITDLVAAQEKLAQQEQALEEKNIALQELITQIEREKKSLQKRIAANVENVVLPSLEKIRLSNGSPEFIEMHRRALEELTSSFGIKVTDSRMKLTPREVEVCSMVRNGLTNKEIARLLSIAIHTVEKHRRTARKKLCIANKGVNLRTYLSSL